jgi:uncharacterized protein
MSKQSKSKSKRPKAAKVPASLVWFEIPADNVGRARKFYSKLFGWKITKFPGAGARDYWHIDTGGADASPDGGMMERQSLGHGVTNYILVASVNKAAARVEKLGGKICMGKTVVPQMGYFAVCADTEGNMFALWERDERAK